MILADLLYDLSNHVLITDHWSADLIRMVIATVSSLTAILLAKLYYTNRTGRMSFCAGAGAVFAYMVIAWAQLVAVSNPITQHDMTALNVGVLIAVTLSLIGTIQAMNIHLFHNTDARPGPIKQTLIKIDKAVKASEGNSEKLDLNAAKLDAIDHAVNTRPEDQPTISEDVRTLVEKQDKRNEKGS